MAEVSVLQLDPDLGAGIVASRRADAERACVARVIELERGSWDGGGAVSDPAGLGLLMLSGTLCRRVSQSGQRGAELLGPGDLLRPWDRISEWASIPTESGWMVIERSRLAVLDARFARESAPFPEIGEALLRRSMLRSRYLAVLLAIVGQRRIETRLEMLFWHLADRFGQVRGEWVRVPVPLTHAVLGELVAARRPSVSTALAGLAERGTLIREGEAWLLRGPAPAEHGRGPAAGG